MRRTRRDKSGKIQWEFWHELNRRGLPRVVLWFAEVDGHAECVRIEIGTDFDNPNEPNPVPLHTQDLRFPLRRMIAEARRENIEHSRRVSEASSWLGEPISKRTREAARRALAAAERDAGTEGGIGRPVTGDLELARVALVYTQADSRAPTQAVVKEFQLTASAAAKRVARARAQGLLSATKPRQAGGRLTAKARGLLEEAGDLPRQGKRRR